MALRTAIHARDAGQPCPECGRAILPGEAVHVDHRVALANGGTDDPANLVTMHAVCNLRKGAR